MKLINYISADCIVIDRLSSIGNLTRRLIQARETATSTKIVPTFLPGNFVLLTFDWVLQVPPLLTVSRRTASAP